MTIINEKTNASTLTGVAFLRVYSAIAITVAHSFYFYQQSVYTHFGYFFVSAVSIFVFLSGFLIGNKDSLSPTMFIKKRILRIVPSYFIALALFAGIYYFILNQPLPLGKFITHLFFVNWFLNIKMPGLGHFWYLSFTMLAYGLVLFDILLRKQYKISVFNKKNIGFAAAITILLETVAYFLHLPEKLFPLLFLFYVGYYISYNKITISILYIKSGLLLSILVIAAFAYFSETMPVNNHLYCWFEALFGCTIVLLLANRNNIFINNPIINYGSKFSYELYLVHQPFIFGPIILFLVGLHVDFWLYPLAAGLIVVSTIIVKTSSDLIQKRVFN